MTVEPEEMRSALSYCAESGEFRWTVRPTRKVRCGDVAGSRTDVGYVRIKWNGKAIAAHRLAWWFVHGKWPDGDIDHINGDKADNRIANLRDVSRSVNIQNARRARANNKAGALGVSPSGSGYRATIVLNGQYRGLGHYRTVSEASDAYVAAKRMLHEGCTI